MVSEKDQQKAIESIDSKNRFCSLPEFSQVSHSLPLSICVFVEKTIDRTRRKKVERNTIQFCCCMAFCLTVCIAKCFHLFHLEHLDFQKILEAWKQMKQYVCMKQYVRVSQDFLYGKTESRASEENSEGVRREQWWRMETEQFKIEYIDFLSLLSSHFPMT